MSLVNSQNSIFDSSDESSYNDSSSSSDSDVAMGLGSVRAGKGLGGFVVGRTTRGRFRFRRDRTVLDSPGQSGDSPGLSRTVRARQKRNRPPCLGQMFS